MARRGPIPLVPRAPLTGTAFDFVLIEVPCTECGKNGKQALAELVANNMTACSYCGAVIDLTSEGWRTRLAEQSQKFKEIKKLRP